MNQKSINRKIKYCQRENEVDITKTLEKTHKNEGKQGKKRERMKVCEKAGRG